ncbi:MAG: DUF1800 family protein [Bacteroidota bacterium]
MKSLSAIVLLSMFLSSPLAAQFYDDYLGAGHAKGIRVRSSSEVDNTSAFNTVNGSGLDTPRKLASRFLAQAAFGGSEDQIDYLVADDLDYAGWIDEQMELPTTWFLPKLWEIDRESERLYYEEYDTTLAMFEDFEYYGPFSVHFQYTWWDNNAKGEDKLRQRIAYALSQIFVISINSNLNEFGEGLAYYYDNFMRHSFGNYKDLMLDVSIDPNMGYYLSHLNNRKTDEENGINPDQNYAREIMQLFSIGLYELNNDGTRKTDGAGEWIPTYDNDDIIGLSKVFTGLKGGEWSRAAVYYGADPNSDVEFGADIYAVSREHKMAMDEEWHEAGEKNIIGDFTIPSGQTGMQDIEMAVDHLFMHPNVGPFVARRLIQQLVKSNPSPAYVNRVANAFNNNGSGIRGDMKAVIKAVLLDEEARSCEAMDDPLHGKLREPIMRFTHIMNAIEHDNPTGNYWNNGFDYFDDTKQAPLAASSVFNFYLPDFQPAGQISAADGVAPEYQIHNTQTAIGYLNQVHKWTDWGVLFWDWHGREWCGDPTRESCPELTPNVDTDLTELAELAEDPETLLNHLDVMLTHGRLSLETRQIIKEAITPLDGYGNANRHRAQLALYLVMISPDYVVLK